MDKDKKQKFNKLATVMGWVFGLAVWLQVTEFSYNLMNKSNDYLFYVGLFTLVAANVTAALIINGEINRVNKNNN